MEYDEWARGVTDGEAQNNHRNVRLRQMRRLAAKLRGDHTAIEWTELVREFVGRCVRCGAQGERLEKDHITPIYQGGSEHIGNLQPLCKTCNTAKGPENYNWVDHRSRRNGF